MEKLKMLLSCFIVGAFVIYSLVARKDNDDSVPKVIQAPGNNKGLTSGTNPPVNIPEGPYKNGEYIGSLEDAFWGNVQVKALISNGNISEVEFLSFPGERETSIAINTRTMKLLKEETIKSQSADIDIISGATYTSTAYIKSLTNALKTAKK